MSNDLKEVDVPEIQAVGIVSEEVKDEFLLSCSRNSKEAKRMQQSKMGAFEIRGVLRLGEGSR